MSGPVRMSVVADVKDAVTGMGQAGTAAQNMGKDFDRAGDQARNAAANMDGLGEGADTVASKGSQAAGALTGLGDLVGGPFGTAMQTGGIAMQAAADAGDLLNVAVEGGAKLAGKMASGVGKLTSALKLDKAAKVTSTAAQWALNAAMSANPLGLIVLAIAAVVAGLAVFFTKTEIGRKAFKAFSDTAMKVVKPIGGLIKTYVTAYFEVAQAAVKGFIWFFTDGIPAAFETFKNLARSAFNFVADIWNNTVGKLSFRVPSWVPVIGGKGFDVPDIPRFAGGGTVYGPTLALLGDNPSGVEYAIPKEVIDRLGGGGPSVVIQGGMFIGASRAEVGRWLSDALDDYYAAGGRRLGLVGG
jgi:hypothetical protein